MARGNSRLRVVELYAGTGRSIEPYRVRRRDFEVSLLVDVSVRAREAYLENHRKAPYALLDLAAASAREIEDLAGGKVDILLGCPPCQGFSESGHRRGDDPRNDHIVRFAEMVRDLRPVAFAMENVPLAALSARFSQFRRVVEKAGYEVVEKVMNAAEYGSAQAGQRLVVVGRRGRGSGLDVALPRPTHGTVGEYFDYGIGEIRSVEAGDHSLFATTGSTRRASALFATSPCYDAVSKRRSTPTVGDVIGDLPKASAARGGAFAHAPYVHDVALVAAMRGVAEGGKRDVGGKYHGAAYGRLHSRGLAKTLTRYFQNAGSGRFWHPTEERTLTVREAARLQGYDDGFRFLSGFSKANAFMIGNALDRTLAEASFKALQRTL